MRTIGRGVLAAATFLSVSSIAQAADVKSVIDGLPAELKAQYDGAPQKILPSAWDNFKAPAKPWKWCHSESYQGNPWRVAVTNELKRLVDGLIADGTVASFEVSDSNNDTSQQINQIRAFIDKGCSIITSIPGSATALDDAVDAAAKAGIPFITAAGSVTSPNAINVDSNYARWGYDMMTAIGMFRASGALDALIGVIRPALELIGIPSDVLPLALLRPITGAGSLAFVTDLIKEQGPDSFAARVASTIQGSTDTTLYVLTVYFGAIGIRNARYALKVGLFSDLVGFFAAVFACWLLFGLV